MSAPDPRANPDLMGHEAAEGVIAEAMRSTRMHHAWLISGPEGVGKATLAFRFARRLLAGAPAGASLALAPDHPVFARVAAGSHADLLTVVRTVNPGTGRLRGEIVVDDARRAGDFLRLTPAEGGWRVVVVDRVDEMNRNAANALLKVLEEPPARAVLLLVCDAPGRLLPTIRSRCRRLALGRLEEATVRGLLERYAPELEADAAARIAMLAEGSIGRALKLAGSGGVASAALVDQVLGTAPDRLVAQAHAFADALGRDEAAFATFMDLLRAALAAAVRDAARGRADPDQARLLGDRPLAAWVDVWHALGRLRDETEGIHLDTRQAVVTGLALLAEGPSRAP